MNEASKTNNRWKAIAIVAIAVALIACGVVVYLLNRPVPETPVLTSIDQTALQAEPTAEPQPEPTAEPTAESINPQRLEKIAVLFCFIYIVPFECTG